MDKLPSIRRPSVRWAVALAVVLAIFAGSFYLRRVGRPPPIPTINTKGLEPAVAKLIDDSVGAVRVTPHFAEAWGQLGTVLMHYEFLAAAGDAFDQAERLDSRNLRWPYLHALMLLAREPAAAVPKLRRAVDAAGGRSDMPRLQLAQLLAEQGKVDEAKQHFQTLLRGNPGHEPALLGLARLSLAGRNYRETEKYLERCLRDPHTAKAAFALTAQVQQALGNRAAAEEASRKSASLPPDQAWPDPYWAEALRYRLGRKALLENASSLLDQERFPEAIEALNRIARDYPDDAEAWYLMGWAFNRAQGHADAERALREYSRRMPDSPKGLSQLAVTLLSQRRYDEAVGVLEVGLKLKPTWRELHFNLAYACLQLGREEEAIRHLRDALVLDPNHIATYTALAELLARRGQRDEARQLLRQANEINPLDQRVQALLQQIGAE